MDLLFASLSPEAATRFHEIPVVCLPALNVENEDWEIFTYGTGTAAIFGATPVYTGIFPFVTGGLWHNLGLVASLAKHSNPSNFMVNVDTRRCKKSSNDTDKMNFVMRQIADLKVPYQIEFGQDYRFSPSKCGTFATQTPCWLRVFVDNKFEPDMVLVPPGTVPVEWCNPARKYRKKTWTAAMYKRVSELIPQGKVWHPDQICPDYRLVCGARTPPNLPRPVSICGEQGKQRHWVQIPRNASKNCEANANGNGDGSNGGNSTLEEDPDCVGLRSLQSGVLPRWNEPSMRWIQIEDGSGQVCRASNVRDAARIATHHPKSEPNSCIMIDPSFRLAGSTFEWSKIKGRRPRTNSSTPLPGPQDSISPISPPKWNLIKDDRGNFEFVMRDSNVLRGSDAPNSTTHTHEIIPPLSQRDTYGSRMREWRRRRPRKQPKKSTKARPPGRRGGATRAPLVNNTLEKDATPRVITPPNVEEDPLLCLGMSPRFCQHPIHSTRTTPDHRDESRE